MTRMQAMKGFKRNPGSAHIIWMFGLAEATKDLNKGWELAEEGKKKRHEAVLAHQTKVLDIERKKLEVSMLFANGVQGVASTLNWMVDRF